MEAAAARERWDSSSPSSTRKTNPRWRGASLLRSARFTPYGSSPSSSSPGRWRSTVAFEAASRGLDALTRCATLAQRQEAPARGAGQCGFESRGWHDAKIDQRQESPVSESGQCGFESLSWHHPVVDQSEGVTGLKRSNRGWGTPRRSRMNAPGGLLPRGIVLASVAEEPPEPRRTGTRRRHRHRCNLVVSRRARAG